MKTIRWLHTLMTLAGLIASATVCPAQVKTDASPAVARGEDSVRGKTNAPSDQVRESQPAATTSPTLITANPFALGTNVTAAVAVPKALTLVEIKEMAGKGVSDETLLNALRASGAVYILTTKEVNALQQAKVSETIIDYMLATPRRLQERDRLLPVYYPLYWPSLYHDRHSSFYHDYHPTYSHGASHGFHR